MYRASRTTSNHYPMDSGIIAALAMLVVWAIGTFAFEGPGWIHALLTAGVFLLIWRLVVRGTPAASTPHDDRDRPKQRKAR